MTKEQQGTVALMQGDREFPSFQAMLDLTIAAAPHREPKSLRRGVFHNSRQLDNGNWAWRYDAIRDIPRLRRPVGRRRRAVRTRSRWSAVARRASSPTTMPPNSASAQRISAACTSSRIPGTPCKATSRWP